MLSEDGGLTIVPTAEAAQEDRPMAMEPVQDHRSDRTDILDTKLSPSTGRRDLAVHDEQTVVMYNTRVEAEAARRVVMMHAAASHAEVADHADARVASEDGNADFRGSLERLSTPDEEARGYAEGVRRGYALLIVHPTPETREMVIEVIEFTNQVDLGLKLEQWRNAGWNDRQMTDADIEQAVADDPDAAPILPDEQMRREYKIHPPRIRR